MSVFISGARVPDQAGLFLNASFDKFSHGRINGYLAGCKHEIPREDRLAVWSHCLGCFVGMNRLFHIISPVILMDRQKVVSTGIVTFKSL